ncbi:MAG: GNAT family N-acetyltransferase [Vampirovibrionales bacterium]|nr:GNAT family N-acetyltransferase [Vampirovibrionales bacterium]
MVLVIQRYSKVHFDLAPLVQLFRDYQAFNAALGIPLDFQGFEAEVVVLPGRYATSQGGELYLALWQGQPVGCTAYYRFDATTAELKRLFVSASVTGQGIGKWLIEAALEDATEAGYERMILDSVGRLTAARKLYERMGFEDISSYNDNPFEDAYFMEKRLRL